MSTFNIAALVESLEESLADKRGDQAHFVQILTRRFKRDFPQVDEFLQQLNVMLSDQLPQSASVDLDWVKSNQQKLIGAVRMNYQGADSLRVNCTYADGAVTVTGFGAPQTLHNDEDFCKAIGAVALQYYDR